MICESDGEYLRSSCGCFRKNEPTITIIKLLLPVFILVTFATAKQWVLVWSDEFDVEGYPDPSRWRYEEGYVRNDEAQYFTRERLENARVEDGKLIIEAHRDNWNGQEITSASLHTAHRGDWLYGRVEVRAKVPQGTGTWPAIWMMPTDSEYGYWPASGEIDIREYVGFMPELLHANVHTEAYNHTLGNNSGAAFTVSQPWENFVLWAIEWCPEEIVFFYEQEEVFRYINQNTGSTQWPFDKRFYLILNLAIGGSWGGTQGIDTTIFPARFEIDYVRVYQLAQPGPYTVNTTVSGYGTASVEPSLPHYDSGATVQLTATPDPGFQFSRWSGGYTGSENTVSLSVDRSISAIAHFSHPNELLCNGGFFESLFCWGYWANNDAVVVAGALDGVCSLTVQTSGDNSWDIQFAQSNIPLIYGHSYLLSFRVRATEESEIVANLQLREGPWTTYFSTDIDLTTEWETYQIEWSMNSPDDSLARLLFNCGTAEGTIYLSDVSLVDVTAYTGQSYLQPRLLRAPSPKIKLSGKTLYVDMRSYSGSGTETVRLFQTNGRVIFTSTVQKGQIVHLNLPARLSKGFIIAQIDNSVSFMLTPEIMQ